MAPNLRIRKLFYVAIYFTVLVKYETTADVATDKPLDLEMLCIDLASYHNCLPVFVKPIVASDIPKCLVYLSPNTQPGINWEQISKRLLSLPLELIVKNEPFPEVAPNYDTEPENPFATTKCIEIQAIPSEVPTAIKPSILGNINLNAKKPITLEDIKKKLEELRNQRKEKLNNLQGDKDKIFMLNKKPTEIKLISSHEEAPILGVTSIDVSPNIEETNQMAQSMSETNLHDTLLNQQPETHENILNVLDVQSKMGETVDGEQNMAGSNLQSVDVINPNTVHSNDNENILDPDVHEVKPNEETEDREAQPSDINVVEHNPIMDSNSRDIQNMADPHNMNQEINSESRNMNVVQIYPEISQNIEENLNVDSNMDQSMTGPKEDALNEETQSNNGNVMDVNPEMSQDINHSTNENQNIERTIASEVPETQVNSNLEENNIVGSPIMVENINEIPGDIFHNDGINIEVNPNINQIATNPVVPHFGKLLLNQEHLLDRPVLKRPHVIEIDMIKKAIEELKQKHLKTPLPLLLPKPTWKPLEIKKPFFPILQPGIPTNNLQRNSFGIKPNNQQTDLLGMSLQIDPKDKKIGDDFYLTHKQLAPAEVVNDRNLEDNTFNMKMNQQPLDGAGVHQQILSSSNNMGSKIDSNTNGIIMDSSNSQPMNVNAETSRDTHGDSSFQRVHPNSINNQDIINNNQQNIQMSNLEDGSDTIVKNLNLNSQKDSTLLQNSNNEDVHVQFMPSSDSLGEENSDTRNDIVKSKNNIRVGNVYVINQNNDDDQSIESVVIEPKPKRKLVDFFPYYNRHKNDKLDFESLGLFGNSDFWKRRRV